MDTIAYFVKDLKNTKVFITRKSDKPIDRTALCVKRDTRVQVKVRSVKKFRELAYCNEWDCFVTLTLSPKCFEDRFNYAQSRSKMAKILNHYRERVDKDFRYLLVPELHVSGAIHFHGFMKFGITDKTVFNYSKTGNSKLWSINMVFLEKIGINQCCWFNKDNCRTTVPKKAMNYCVKYATKADITICKHNYFCSKGLRGYERFSSHSIALIDFVRKHCNWSKNTEYGTMCWIDNETLAGYELQQRIDKKKSSMPLKKQLSMDIHNDCYIEHTYGDKNVKKIKVDNGAQWRIDFIVVDYRLEPYVVKRYTYISKTTAEEKLQNYLDMGYNVELHKIDEPEYYPVDIDPTFKLESPF